LCIRSTSSGCWLPNILTVAGIIYLNETAKDNAGSADQQNVQNETNSTTGNTPPDDDDEKDARDAKRVSSNKEADRIARNNGYNNAHHLKSDNQLDSKTDLFVGRDGKVYAGDHSGRGAREWLGIWRKGYK